MTNFVKTLAGGACIATAAMFSTATPSQAGTDPFIGEVMLIGGSYCPRGWAEANGALLPISANSAMFSLLGTIYGGDGRTTFGLPDLRGRVPVGIGAGPGLNNMVQGQQGGSEDVTLGTNNMPAHTHAVTVTEGSLAVTASSALNSVRSPANSTLPAGNRLAIATSNVYSNSTNTDSPMKDGAVETTVTISGLPDVAISNTGGSQPTSNMQPYLGVRYCIATVGIFPSR